MSETNLDRPLTEDEQQILLKMARRAIENAVNPQSKPPIESDEPILAEERGAFVTLHKQGQLRGCIGYVTALKPLDQTIKEMAVAAAMHDPRFDAVTGDELEDLDIEISVLSPLKKVDDVKVIQIGRHGLYVQKGAYSGLLLPQVASEYGWDRHEFLAQTCRKAGLPPNAWQDDDTTLYSFSAQIFQE